MTLLGFLLSAVAGVLIGMALAASRRVERMFAPLLVAVNAVPKIALGPLLVVSVGWGQKPILTMVFLLCFFPIVLSTATGLTTTPADLAELARSLNASWWQSFRKVRFPAALPQIFVGLKVAMPLAAIGAVIGEFYSDKPRPGLPDPPVQRGRRHRDRVGGDRAGGADEHPALLGAVADRAARPALGPGHHLGPLSRPATRNAGSPVGPAPTADRAPAWPTAAGRDQA